MKKLICLFSMLFVTTACTKVELGSHLIKQMDPSVYSKNKGTFKVGSTYKVKGKRYTPRETYNYTETGIASWYGPDFHGKLTANGEIYNQHDLTAAHKTLQMPSIVRVTNLENGKSIIVRINDRGPFAHGRIIDLSSRSADLLDIKRKGTAKVRIEVLPNESREVASMAKDGQSTRGMEIAYNKGQKPHIQTAGLTPEYQPNAPRMASYTPKVQAPTPTTYQAPQSLYTTKPVTTEQLVKTYAVQPSNIYVQTASFSDKMNAQRFATSLQRYGHTKIKEISINGRNYYRVKLGPLNDVAHADSMLSTLIADGYNDALIVVDTQG